MPEEPPTASFEQWLAAARQAAQQPPAKPRHPLVVAGHVVGSVQAGFLNQIDRTRLNRLHLVLSIEERLGAATWRLDGAPGATLTETLNALAAVLREQTLCGPWRDEQLAVCNPRGDVVGTVERGAVRVLGIATRAVHLVGLAPDGRMWVQKRSMTKPNNPGLWDTLMGGMVSAADTLPQALTRETWEEAGLQAGALTALQHGGHVDFSRPSREGGGAGYMQERIDWFRAEVPAGMEPNNQDGEVERFELLPLDAVRGQVAQGMFTLEAGLVIARFLGL